MARLVLVGLPGTGKTPLARALGERWGCVAIDTDDAVARDVGMPAAQYLREHGETAFRERELDALRPALASNGVVATGAGVVTTPEARDLLEAEFTLWLDCEDDHPARTSGRRGSPSTGGRSRRGAERSAPTTRALVPPVQSGPSGLLRFVRRRGAEGPRSDRELSLVNITVDLKERSYEVVIDEGARDGLSALVARRAPNAQCAAIVTSTSLQEQPWFDLSSGVDQFTVVVPEGESAKTIGSYERLLDSLAEHRLSRDDVVVGVGGGAITDLAGFAAATFLRGVALVQVPTSLVAQVDAAIGGKTGINIPAGKNLVGAFHQPLGVLCDTSVLSTLPERERRNGLGEVAKCWLLEGRDAANVEATPLTDLIELSVQLKATIVASDEREGDARALLNYGHTLAHALEAVVLSENSDELRHGEAVAVGLAFAARLARALGRVGEDVVIDARRRARRFWTSTALKRSLRRGHADRLDDPRQKGPSRLELRVRRSPGL